MGTILEVASGKLRNGKIKTTCCETFPAGVFGQVYKNYNDGFNRNLSA